VRTWLKHRASSWVPSCVEETILHLLTRVTLFSHFCRELWLRELASCVHVCVFSGYFYVSVYSRPFLCFFLSSVSLQISLSPALFPAPARSLLSCLRARLWAGVLRARMRGCFCLWPWPCLCSDLSLFSPFSRQTSSCLVLSLSLAPARSLAPSLFLCGCAHPVSRACALSLSLSKAKPSLYDSCACLVWLVYLFDIMSPYVWHAVTVYMTVSVCKCVRYHRSAFWRDGSRNSTTHKNLSWSPGLWYIYVTYMCDDSSCNCCRRSCIYCRRAIAARHDSHPVSIDILSWLSYFVYLYLHVSVAVELLPPDTNHPVSIAMYILPWMSYFVYLHLYVSIAVELLPPDTTHPVSIAEICQTRLIMYPLPCIYFRGWVVPCVFIARLCETRRIMCLLPK